MSKLDGIGPVEAPKEQQRVDNKKAAEVAPSKVKGDDSVLSSIAPELPDIDAAEMLGQVLGETLLGQNDKAMDAAGQLDEARVRELLED